jgi:hypothetical protein
VKDQSLSPSEAVALIAKAAGWKYIEPTAESVANGYPNWPYWQAPAPTENFFSSRLDTPPNYLKDRGALHEACEVILGESTGWITFIDNLCEITGAVNVSMMDVLVITQRASTPQLAEALVRTLRAT